MELPELLEQLRVENQEVAVKHSGEQLLLDRGLNFNIYVI